MAHYVKKTLTPYGGHYEPVYFTNQVRCTRQATAEEVSPQDSVIRCCEGRRVHYLFLLENHKGMCGGL